MHNEEGDDDDNKDDDEDDDSHGDDVNNNDDNDTTFAKKNKHRCAMLQKSAMRYCWQILSTAMKQSTQHVRRVLRKFQTKDIIQLNSLYYYYSLE